MEDVEEGAEHVFQDWQEVLPEVQEPNPFKGGGEEAVVCEEEVKLASFEQQIAELKDVGVKHLTLAAPLLNRKEATVIAATSKLFARYRALQVPVFRIKTDRAKEFVSKRFREWTTARDLEHCFTAGDEPTGNSRAEIEVGVLKNAARVLLQSAGLPVRDWPTALRHAAEERHRGQLRAFGLNLPWLIPYGCKAMVRTKTWHRRWDEWKHPMIEATVMGLAEGMASSAGAYWVMTIDGHGLRTTVTVRPHRAATIEGGVQAVGSGSLGDGGLDRNRPERDGQDAAELLHQENPHSIANQLKEAAEFWAVFDGKAQPPSPDRDGDPGDGEGDAQADDFEAQVHGLLMTEVDEQDAVNRRYRLQGKQPAHRLHQQGRRPGGEEVYAAVKALKKSVDLLKHQELEECQGCGLRKVAVEMECRVCETSTKKDKVENIVLEGIKSITKEVQVMNEPRQGLQQVIVDEVAMSISPEGQTDACIRQLRRDAMWLDRKIQDDHQELVHIMKAVGTGEKEATPQEAEVLQTYLVGTKQILEERDLWIPPVENEVMVLENTGTLVRKTPGEVKTLVDSGVYIEIIPGKLLCSRKAPCGRRKARIVGCGNFGTPDKTVTTSTGGIDAVALRVMMMVASQRGWACGSTDIKSAFPQAPKRSAAHRVTLVKPPQLVVQLGIVPPGTMWAAEGALYGLRESPEDWTCRNQCLRKGSTNGTVGMEDCGPGWQGEGLPENLRG